jgi:hypothetical protein
VEDGRRQFIEGEYKRAITQLDRARSLLLAKVALVASDQGLRDLLHKASLFLSHALLRDKQGERAAEVVSQVIRSFPDRDLSMVRYGPELVAFYKRVRREMDRQARGTLTIATRPLGCLVFLNERYVGLSPAKVVDLYPGQYRVYVQRPRERGRIHRAKVEGGEHRVSVDFELDRRLQTERYVGLQYESRQEMERNEAKHAARVARALEAPTVVVVGVRRYQGRRTLQGTTVSADTGRVIRSGLVVLEPAAPSPDTLKALGQFLLAGKRGSGVIVRAEKGGRDPSLSSTASPGDHRDRHGAGFFSARVFKWITLGLAVAGLASGITLLALDGRGTCDAAPGGLCLERYETKAPGIVLTAAGGAAAVAAGVLFYLDLRGGQPGRGASAVLLPWMGGDSGGLAAVVAF